MIVLHEGKVVKEGPAEEAMDFYHALLAARDVNLIRQERNVYGKVQTVSGGGEITVSEVRLLTGDGKPVEAVETGTNVRLEITARVNKSVEEAVMGFMIKDRFGQTVYGINSYRLGETIEHLSVGEQLVFCFEFVMNLGKGNYSITTAISKMDSHLSDNYEWCDSGLIFSVLNTRKADFAGIASLDAVLSVERVSARHNDKQDDNG